MKKVFTYLQVILTIKVIILLNVNLFGQLSAPSANAIYGGRINAITGYGTSGTSSRIFIATESANSLFYADVTSTLTTPAFGNFTSVPDVNSNDNFGSAISQISAHSSSGYLFFIASGNLYKVNTTASSISTISSSGQVSSLLVYENYLFYIDGSNFVSETLDVTGAVTATVSFAHGITGTTSIKVSPSNSKVYIGVISTTSPKLYKSNDNYTSLTSGSSFSSISLVSVGMTASVTWNGFGIGPDGALFFGGDLSSTKYVNYSTSASDGAAWSGGTTALSGVSNSVFSFGGGASPYNVNYSKGHAMYTSGSGFTTPWTEFGNMGFATHPNDGPVFVDPTNSGIIYLTTDQGLGKSTDYGSVISEFDDGIEAVQVNDFSMNSGKTMAWLASKAGVRKVTDYSTTPVWTNAIFPNSDGSPYYSAEMENNNDATAYVGNLRIYKTTDSGLNWTQVLSEGSYPSFGTRVEAIEVCPTNSSLVLAGFYVDGATQGGLWYSTNAGTNWTQLQLRSGSTIPNDVDVYDIDFTSEGGIPVAYIGVEYDSTTSTRSVYRAEYSSGVWTARQDFDGSYTAVSYAITATIMDVNVVGNYIYVCGTDAGSNHPIVYSRDYTAAYTTAAGKWTTLTTTGFPTSQVGSAVAVGGGVVNCAVSNIIYSIPETSGTTWTVGYTYPTGTQINVLFYDALLAGTGTGLYGHGYYGNLPVELTSFTANVNGQGVVLNWNTATEVNNYGFEIERTVGSGQSAVVYWEKMGFVNGSGNSNSSKDYNFSDDNIAAGKYLYRLKQIDNDGGFKYSNEIEVEIGIPTKFSLSQNYPNPFNPETVISWHLAAGSYVTLKVYDILGNEVATLVNKEQSAGTYQISFNSQLTTDNKQPSSGVYFYQLRAGNFVGTKKMILMK
jgi:hypothetical protein